MPVVTIYETVEPGEYPARFKSVEERVSEKNGRPFWRWEFDVDVGGEIHTTTGTSSTSFSPRSKSYEWVSAILKRKPAGGESVEWADLAGMHCLLILGLSEDEEFNTVDKVLPARTASKSDAPPF